MPKVSVIVPVYNAGNYIEKCLESLRSQTLDDIEIIFVDDHGSDDSIDKIVSFIDGYSGNKTFLLTSTERNSGPGAARNRGMDEACGEYVAFMDSDDYVEPGFCEELCNLANDNDADLVCCDILIGESVKRNAEVSDKKCFLRHFVSYFTTFIYRKAMLDANGIRFPEASSAEDTCFLAKCVLSAGKMAQIHKPLYHYVQHEDSVSRKKNRRRAFARMNSIRSIICFAKRNGLYREYRNVLNLILLKKGYGMALKDLIFG